MNEPTFSDEELAKLQQLLNIANQAKGLEVANDCLSLYKKCQMKLKYRNNPPEDDKSNA